ncbi:MAG TPA: glucoamylase family protein [Flavobacterium sp.]|mgnify:CR=1 FL=1|uniref:glucoamylase family protein n=1 Tax=unclassified Flavobacterium TaxID=196869 RepID=UPI000E8A64DA|nr:MULTISPECIES: glucoamylase family protein [unclassified Flavobacterium]HBI00381.1 beta-glucosidase [Flavobacterium sp.]HRE76759.1 glucoamylase family protein [Flavobacterium sp.]
MHNLLRILIILQFFIISCSCSKNNDDVVVEEDDVVLVPPMTDQEILDLAQRDAFKYFWNYAEVNSKLARERYHVEESHVDANLVATGGSGFGLMTILVGIERGFVTRGEAVGRLQTALTFLENADRFHGAWSHWINGANGNTIPFGTIDNGGDIVETSFMCQALICIREYFKDGSEEEQALAQKADDLWKGVEWDWYTKGENAMYWHWSPDYEWQLNFKLEGYNECLITYIMGASSPTHPIPNEAYHQAWARNGNIVTSASNYGIPKIFNYNGASIVGPMFWSHYSYLGLDPRGLTDQYANYWELTQNHTKIMHAYCVANPGNFDGYSDECWGLTAGYTRNSNGTVGYTDHKPGNDRGVITPTAALSSFPYTPEESMKALRYFYENPEWKDRLIGVAGPYDAFSPHHNWYTKRYLAIDQGTIVPMIENHRTGFLWNLFMQAPEVRTGLQNLGFSSSQHGF